MSTWEDKSGRKHVGVMVEGRRVHRILPPGATANDAKLVEAELRAAIKRQPKVVNIPGDPPMMDILRLYAEHANSLRSKSTSKLHAARMAGPAQSYRASQAQEFAAEFIKCALARKLAPATINRSLACAKKGLDIAWRERLIPENYGLRIRALPVNNKREVFLTVEQVGVIALHCSPQVRAAVWFALLTGARRGEILQVRAEHIGADVITLPASHTKTNRMRVIPIIPALRPWLKHFPLDIKFEGLKSGWQRARLKAGMEHVNFHDLRHSCASIMLGLGVDLYTISKILGHSNITTTQRYSHLQVDAQRAALDKLSVLVQPGLHPKITQA